MKTGAIENFLQKHYSDEKLAVLLAHTEDGKLRFTSCCCFIGIATADHVVGGCKDHPQSVPHYKLAEALDQPSDWKGTGPAELAFLTLGKTDIERREGLLPLIHAEIARRDALREDVGTVRATVPAEMEVDERHGDGGE